MGRKKIRDLRKKGRGNPQKRQGRSRVHLQETTAYAMGGAICEGWQTSVAGIYRRASGEGVPPATGLPGENRLFLQNPDRCL
jgi:hypothetical protein